MNWPATLPALFRTLPLVCLLLLTLSCNQRVDTEDDGPAAAVDTSVAKVVFAPSPPLDKKEALKRFDESLKRYQYVMSGGQAKGVVIEKDQMQFIPLAEDLNSEKKITEYLRPVFSDAAIERTIMYMSLGVVNDRYVMEKPLDEPVPVIKNPRLDSTYANGPDRSYDLHATVDGEPKKFSLIYRHEQGRWLLDITAGELGMEDGNLKVTDADIALEQAKLDSLKASHGIEDDISDELETPAQDKNSAEKPGTGTDKPQVPETNKPAKGEASAPVPEVPAE